MPGCGGTSAGSSYPVPYSAGIRNARFAQRELFHRSSLIASAMGRGRQGLLVTGLFCLCRVSHSFCISTLVSGGLRSHLTHYKTESRYQTYDCCRGGAIQLTVLLYCIRTTQQYSSTSTSIVRRSSFVVRTLMSIARHKRPSIAVVVSRTLYSYSCMLCQSKTLRVLVSSSRRAKFHVAAVTATHPSITKNKKTLTLSFKHNRVWAGGIKIGEQRA